MKKATSVRHETRQGDRTREYSMRKNLFARILSLILSSILLLSLAACAGQEGEAGTTDEPGADQGSGTVYVPEYLTLEGYPDMANQLVISDGVLYGAWRTIDPEIHESVYVIARWDLDTLEKEELPYQVSGGTINQLAVAADGTVALLVNNTGGDKSGYYVVLLEEDGQLRAELPVGDLIAAYGDGTDFSVFPMALAVDGDGNTFLLLHGTESAILALDSQGSKKFELTDADFVDLVTGRDGTVYALTLEDNGSGYALKAIAADQGSWGESYTGISDASPELYAEDETHFLVSCGDTLYRYDMAAQSTEVILNWLNVDVNSDNLQGFAVLADGRIFASVLTVKVGAATVQNDMVFLTETEASRAGEKTVITYGVWGDLSRQMRQQILDFNKTSEEYHIQVRDYLEGLSYFDLEQGIAVWNAELAAGSGPDLVDLSRLDFANYADKGAFADLNLLLEKDGAIAREDLADSPLRIYERDGSLYGIPLFFYVSTLVGRSDTLQGLTGWTVADIQRILTEQPEEMAFLDSSSRESLLTLLVEYQLDNFVDWEDGTCRFDSQEFIDLLTFAADCPLTEDLSEIYTGRYYKIHERKVLVTATSIGTVVNYQSMLALYDGDAVTFIGYPTADGANGSVIKGVQPVAILESSQKKEGAWAFVKSLLSEDYQKEMSYYYFPVRLSVLEECFQEAMRENTRHSASWVWDDFEYEQVPATKEQIDGVKALIELASPMSSSADEIITGIISEETAAFLAGQKTAEAVAEIIQSRVSVYVSENR